MFPEQIPQTDSGDSLRCKDSSQRVAELQTGRNENAQADANLAREVDDALWQDTILRALDYNNIGIRVSHGMVGLYGHVVTLTNRHQAEIATRGVDGIRGLTNGLIADDRLLSEVATALGSLEHSYGCKFFTGVSHGVVMLSGTVDDPATRLLAEQYAASNPNVRGVINSVRVRGGDANLPDPPFFQPYIGAEFFFLDGISGRVRQVIIDPDNRRVAAMTLQGRFTDQRQKPMSLGNDGSPPPERTLVIPMQAIRYLTTHSGFLNIRSTQSDQYSEFRSADFLIPPSDWKPPYPYCPADVLFPAKQAQAPTQVPEQIESPVAVALAHEVLKDELLENDSLGG